MELIKFCRKCGENTTRHLKTKRCLKCRAAVDAAAWQRKKEAMKADPEKAARYREACRVRMNEWSARQRVLNRHE